MTSVHSNSEQQHGQLVAVEGDVETVAVQLRLLPPSRKILVLPALAPNSTANSSDSFDARAFVRDVHTAFTKRTEMARSFLQTSTSKQPRLVFMNGGAISARAACISRISEKVTKGSIEEAETILNEITKDGVGGLMKLTDEHLQEEQTEPDDISKYKDAVGKDLDDLDTKAMIVAESQDRRAEAMQSEDTAMPSEHEHNEILIRRPSSAVALKSNSDPELQKSWRSESFKKSPHLQKAIFTTPDGDQIVRTVLEVPSRSPRLQPQDPDIALEKRSTFDHGNSESYVTSDMAHQSGNLEDKDMYDDRGLLSPGGESSTSLPATPGVVFGEACLVDMHSGSPGKRVKRAQSCDSFYPTSPYHLRAKVQTGTSREQELSTFPTLLRTTFLKASETTIIRSSTSNGSLSTNSSPSVLKVNSGRTFVDRATDSGKVESWIEPFSEVFPISEDLIIHIIDNIPNHALESVIQSYKNGNYPVFPPTPATPVLIPASPTSVYSRLPSPKSFEGKEENSPSSYNTIETDDSGYEKRPEYDPYAEYNRWPQAFKGQSSVRDKDREVEATNLESLTPIEPPPLHGNAIANKVVELAPVSSYNAISVQNLLRQLLSTYFPSGEDKYSQHCYPVTSEAERLWKPVFRNDENASIGNEGRTVDQIIAFGCEAGVKREFFLQISGQIERLGMKRDGVNRSGKLDIRYLITNALQTYSTLPLIVQNNFSPLSDPKTLAALLVPEIEAFLASNSSTRFLILQYQSTNLPVIFALQQILGSDLLKIAGILDSLSSDPPSMARPTNHLTLRHLRGSSPQRAKTEPALDLHSNIVLLGATALTNQELTPFFSRANYLLPSTATDAEITTFLSCIWKLLVEKSAFYTPEPEIKPIMITERPPMPLTPTASSPRDRDFGYPSSSYRGDPSKVSRITGNSGAGSTYAKSVHEDRHRSPSRHLTRRGYAAGIDSVPPRPKTPSNEHSERDREMERERKVNDALAAAAAGERAETQGDWESFYIGEDDSDDDEFDRMIMGRQGAKIIPEPRRRWGGGVQPHGNKKKALKWLGLA